MTRYVIYREFGKLKITNEDNYNAVVQNANAVTDLSLFKDFNQVVTMLVKYGDAKPEQFIDKTND